MLCSLCEAILGTILYPNIKIFEFGDLLSIPSKTNWNAIVALIYSNYLPYQGVTVVTPYIGMTTIPSKTKKNSNSVKTKAKAAKISQNKYIHAITKQNKFETETSILR